MKGGISFDGQIDSLISILDISQFRINDTEYIKKVIYLALTMFRNVILKTFISLGSTARQKPPPFPLYDFNIANLFNSCNIFRINGLGMLSSLVNSCADTLFLAAPAIQQTALIA